MSTSRTRAVSALERWRRFEEARAAIVHAQARCDALAAEQARDQARARALDAGRQRTVLLAADCVDLPRWQAAAAIEDALWRDTEPHEQRVADASERAANAMQEHLRAHVMVEVAAQRCERLRADAATTAEKSDFERIADLRGGSRGSST